MLITTSPSLDSIYGLNVNAKIDRASNKYLYIDNNLSSLDDFINTIYRKTNPIYNNLTELKAPDPTHIQVSYNDESYTIPISDYNKPIFFNNPIKMYDNVKLLFIREIAGTPLKLSIAEMTVRGYK